MIKLRIMTDGDLQNLAKSIGIQSKVLGLADWEYGGCSVFIRQPNGTDDLEMWRALYHEVMHCQIGRFHGHDLYRGGL